MRAKGFTWVVLISSDSGCTPPQPAFPEPGGPLALRTLHAVHGAEAGDRAAGSTRRDAWSER